MNSYNKLINKESSESSEGKKDQLSQKVIGCAIEVHRHLGPGLLESTYQHCLVRELTFANLSFEVQVPLPVIYKNIRLDCGYRVDLLVENCLIIELKAIEQLQRIHEAQIITYMKLAKISSGLLINFNVKLLRDGIRRLFHSSSPMKLSSS